MNALTTRIRDARLRSLLLIERPELWAFWPFLPLVRFLEGGQRQCGVLYDARGTTGKLGYSSTVFLQNLFALPAAEETLLAGPKCVYDTIDLLLDDHWRVD